MPVKDRELREALKFGIKTLVIQEVRLLRLEHGLTPPIMLNEMSHSIRDTKREIVKLTKSVAQKERGTLLRKMIRRAIDEEVDRAIELRKTRCVRCLHGRFYDREGNAQATFPVETRAEAVGCDKLRPSLKKSCRRFVEMSTAASLDDYLDELAFLYEYRDVLRRMEEIWKDYLTK